MATYIIQRCFGLDTLSPEKLQAAYLTAQAQGQTEMMSKISDQMARNNMSSTTSIAIAKPATPKPPTGVTTSSTQSFAKGHNVGYGAGYSAGQKSVGIKQGFQNSWRNMSGMGKAGVVAGGALLAGMAIKGATSTGGNKEKDNRGQSY